MSGCDQVHAGLYPGRCRLQSIRITSIGLKQTCQRSHTLCFSHAVSSTGQRKRVSGSAAPSQTAGRQQSMPMPAQRAGPQSLPTPAQRPGPHMQQLHKQGQAPRPGGPMNPHGPARKVVPPALQTAPGPPGKLLLPQHRQQTPLPLMKASVVSGGTRPAHVVVVGDKIRAPPSQDSAGKSQLSQGQHSMINVDARSAPRGPSPQGMTSMDPSAEPWAGGQSLHGGARPPVSSPTPQLLPMPPLSRHMSTPSNGRPQSAPMNSLNAPQSGRVSLTPNAHNSMNVPQTGRTSLTPSRYVFTSTLDAFIFRASILWFLPGCLTA